LAGLFRGSSGCLIELTVAKIAQAGAALPPIS
jgi:hypothetical protein